MQQLLLFAKALSDPTRLRIVAALRHGELCVCELMDALGVPQSSLSTHLQCLRQCGVATSSKKGTWAYYNLAEWVRPVLDSLDAHFVDRGEDVDRDSKKLQARLELRQNGCCVVGSGKLIQLGDRNDR